MQKYFPVNKLRNIAKDHCPTTHLLMVDVDFMPNRDLETSVNQLIENKFFEAPEVCIIP